ncbi:MAG: hypothetical protein WC455_25825 [Dehalococcoidia bacterium]|jgi:hypothetical protein
MDNDLEQAARARAKELLEAENIGEGEYQARLEELTRRVLDEWAEVKDIRRERLLKKHLQRLYGHYARP